MRKLKSEEIELIIFLLKDKPNTTSIIEDLTNKIVKEMNDGGMGSLKFLPLNSNEDKFGEEISIATFLDIDGIPVSVSININNGGDIFELDIFKADFSPLKRFPTPPYNPLPPPQYL